MTRAAIGRGRLVGCAAVVLSLLALVSVGSGAAASTVRVWFLQGEQMVPVERAGSTAAAADNRVVRVIPVSTGKPSTPTPPGDFKVYARIAKWWSTPFREWLLWAVPFNGGVAFHEFPDVPTYPASHGWVRQLQTTARWMYDFAKVGMPVKVLAASP
jgi:lipoprotein-anchoring transpeptidase ErfK/SrfK